MSTVTPPSVQPAPAASLQGEALRRTPSSASSPEIRYLRPATGWRAINLEELWRFRELFWIFALRDIKVRYKQTIIGAAWALIQPIAFTLLGVFVFGRAVGLGTDGVEPIFLFFLVSQLPWMLFNTGLQTSSMSLVNAQNMLKKVYFPRLVLPVSAVMVSLVDLLVQIALVTLVMIALPFLPGGTAVTPPLQVVLLPVAVLWTFLAALSVGLPLAALNVEFRDVRYVIPFITQFAIFAAPVFWPASRLPDAWRALYGLVPVAAPIEFFRWCVLGTPAHPGMWAVGVVSTTAFLALGLAYFARMEDRFADVV